MTEVDAQITRDAVGPYHLRLVITDPEGGIRERRVDGATCAEVAGAAAVILALASDDDAPAPAEAAPISPPPVASPPSTSGDVDPAPPVIPPAAVDASSPRVWDVAVIGGVDFTSLPGPAPGFGVGVRLAVGPSRLELRATAWLPERARLASRTAVGGDIALYAGALRYCRMLVEGRIDLGPCAGFEAGAFVASGVGVTTPTTATGPWLAPELALLGAAHLDSRIALTIELDGLVVLARDRFVVTQAGQVFQPPQGTARALVGLHVRFP